MNKRSFLKATGMGIASLAATPIALAGATTNPTTSANSAMPKINMDVSAISVAERKARIAKAQSLMQQTGLDAIVLEPGAAMDYFSGIQWWRSERLTAFVIPKQGEVGVVCPFFEEPSIRESLAVGDDVRVWQEHESPFLQIQAILNDRGIKKGKVGFENSVRYFVLDGLMSQLSNFTHTSAEPVTLGTRMYKSEHELALMHKANEITLAAYQYVWSQIDIGMSQSDVKTLMNQTQMALGGSDVWCLALFNDASAYPHGTNAKQVVKQGSIILLDSGCAVHGYQSDISRTFVFGAPNEKQQRVWNTVRKGQQIAFEQAKLGNTAGSVDDAVRAYYQTLGYGPEYKLPGLSHRTGHGIGMEGHERVNFVHGETQLLKPGMCFSNEPGIYIPGEFGVRLEDCIYMTKTGAQWFTEPPSSLEQPLGKLIPLAS